MGIPTDYTFVATYYDSIDANRGNGNLIGTSVGGAAIANHMLDLNHEDSRYVSYNPIGNFDSLQTGAIKFTYIPNYSDVPVYDRVFFTECEGEGVQKNYISIAHSSGGYITVSISDSIGASIFYGPIGIWLPVAGQEYEMEFDYDFTSGASRFFINGTRLGHVITGTGTRSSALGLFKVGGTWDDGSAPPNNFGIKKLIIFNAVQHTDNYIPGYCLGWADEPTPIICPVFGFVKNPDDSPVAGIRIQAVTSEKYSEDNLQIYLQSVTTTTDSEGYWSLNLIESVTSNTSYTISFYQGSALLKQHVGIVIPNTTSCTPFQTLIP